MAWHFVDLSYPITSAMPHWPGDPQTKVRRCAEYESDGFFLHMLLIGEHSGTHIGAPRHFSAEGSDVSEIPPERLIVAGIRLDVRRKANDDPDYLVGVEDLAPLHERLSHLIEPVVVLVCTGWDRRTGTAYFGGRNELHFPGISVDAIEALAQHRCVVGVGIDTAGIDGGRSTDFGSGRLCAELGRYHLENLRNLDRIDDQCELFIGALPIVGGSGSPCRVIARFEKRPA